MNEMWSEKSGDGDQRGGGRRNGEGRSGASVVPGARARMCVCVCVLRGGGVSA